MRVAWSRSSITGEKRPKQLVAEAWSSSHLPRRQAPSNADRAHRRRARGVEVPAVRREEPRPADDLAGVDGLDGDRAAARGEDLELHAPVSQQVERVRLAALAEEVLARLEAGVLAAARDQLQLRLGQGLEKTGLPRRSASSVFMRAPLRRSRGSRRPPR